MQGHSLERRTDFHRQAVAQHAAHILAMEAKRDVELRELRLELAEIERAYNANCERLSRQLSRTASEADARIAIERQLLQSSEAALRVLQGGLTTADALSEATQVSPRTIYRDIRLMKASGAPIIGEAGMGYVYRPRAAARQ